MEANFKEQLEDDQQRRLTDISVVVVSSAAAVLVPLLHLSLHVLGQPLDRVLRVDVRPVNHRSGLGVESLAFFLLLLLVGLHLRLALLHQLVVPV